VLESAGGRLPHLVLLDTALPDTTGLDVLKQIRARFNQVVLPVVMLTARHNEKAIVAALDSGANDYAVKPFRRSELLARIRMHLRSSQKAAATAAAVTPMSPVAAALAAADEGLSMELQQLLPAAEQLKQVPLLVAQLDGLDVATTGLAPEQLSQLLGAIADTFDAVVEKYAVLKVEASDKLLMVAAPLSSSAANSARNSMQLPVVQLPEGSTTAAAAAGGSADELQGQQQQGQSQSGLSAAAQASAAGVSLQRLLLLAQELMQCLDISSEAAPAGCDSTTADAEQLVLSADPQRAPAIRAAAAALPECCRGALQLRIAVHVGALHAGVVGARRPRYRLLGPALQYVKQACVAAPANTIVATGAAASQLLALGVGGLQPLSVAWPETVVDGSSSSSSSSSSSTQQLWVVTPAAAGSCGDAAAASRSSSDQVHALLKAAASAVAAGAAGRVCNGDVAPAAEPCLQQQQQQHSSRVSSEALQPLVSTPTKHQQQHRSPQVPQHVQSLAAQQQQQQVLPDQQVAVLQQLLAASSALSMPPLAWPQQQQLLQQQLLQQQQLLAAAGLTQQVLTPTAAGGLQLNCPLLSSSGAVWPGNAPLFGSVAWGSGEPANGHCTLTQSAGAAAAVAAGASYGCSSASGASTAAPARTVSGASNNSGSSYEVKAGAMQQQQQLFAPRAGVAGGNAADLGASLAALAGFQLGADDVQQIMQLQQELDLMQQQVAALTGGGLAWATPPAAAADGVCASDKGSSNGFVGGGNGAMLSQAAVAGMLAQLQQAQQCQQQQQQQQRVSAEGSVASTTGTSRKSSRESPPPICEAAEGAGVAGSSSSSSGRGRGRAAAQQLGQLFRRRPRKKSDS
jgi:CheY-like chemotaxis protein